MPLQHTHEHEEQPAPRSAFPPSAVQETPLETAPVPPSVSNVASDAPRYDAAAVKQIIALAEQMQTHHRQTLTPDEIEALGHEVGVEPQFIRRALAQIHAPTPAPILQQKSPQSRQKFAAMRVEAFAFRLTRKQGRLLIVPLALYLMALPYTLGRIDLGDRQSILTPVLLYLLVPSVLALYLGGKGKSYRFGALVGALMGLLCVASLLLSTASINHYTPSLDEITRLSSIWISGGAALGLSGVAAGKVIRAIRSTRPRTKRRLRMRLVLETAE